MTTIRLRDLAVTCRRFGELAGDDTASQALAAATNDNHIDLTDPAHAKALLVWLNKWGCRQFAVVDHPTAAAMLAEWGDAWLARLPARGARLSTVSAQKLAIAADAYADLKPRQASTRSLANGRTSVVTVGATGAAKALHALRPASLLPWDEPIRAGLGHDGDRDSYLEYLVEAQRHCKALEAEATKRGIAPRDIPKALGRPQSSLAKMIDEHYWMTITYDLRSPQ